MALTFQRRRIKKKKLLKKRRKMTIRLIFIASLFMLMGNHYTGNLLFLIGGTSFLKCNRELRTLRHPYSFRDVYPDYRRCDLDSFSEDEYHDLFRFSKPAVRTILNYLTRYRNVPEVVFIPYRYKGRQKYYRYTLDEIFLMNLMYLAVPVRQLEVAVKFGRTPAEVCRAMTWFHEMFYDISKSFLQNENQPWFTERVARRCARATRRKGCPLDDCCGFVDGTLRRQKLLASPVHQWYLNGCFLANLHNIDFPNLISQHFGVKPPTFEQYFGVPRGSLR